MRLVTREHTLCDSIYIKFKAKQNSSMVFQVRTVPLRRKKEVTVGRGMRWALGAGTLLFLDLGGRYMVVFALR